ncbi:MAG: MFS transporter [Proteobacteria bacterium]|nr:MFS transporter [Pseudomonadota bacterium]
MSGADGIVSAEPRGQYISAIVAGALVYAVTMTPPNVMPALVGLFADHFRMSGSQLGVAAAMYPLGLAIVSFTSFRWVRMVDWRRWIAFGLLLMACAIGLQSLCTQFVQIAFLMFIAGVGGGLAASPALTVLGDDANPQRSFGLMILLSVLLPAAILALIPRIQPILGNSATFILLTALSLLSLLCISWLPPGQHARPAGAAREQSSRFSWPLLASLIGMLLFVAGYVAAWNFLERIGNQSHLEQGAILDCLAVGGLIGGLGGFLAIFLGRAMTLRTSFLLAIAATVVSLGCMEVLPLTLGVFFVLSLSFQVWISVNFSNGLTFIALNDTAGTSVALIPGLQSLGASLGSVIAGVAFEQGGRLGVIGSGITIFLLCTVSMLVAFRQTRASCGF